MDDVPLRRAGKLAYYWGMGEWLAAVGAVVIALLTVVLLLKGP